MQSYVSLLITNIYLDWDYKGNRGLLVFLISPWGKNSNSDALTIPLVAFISSFVFSQLNSDVSQDVSSVALGFVHFQPLSVMERTTVGTILMN